MIYINIHKFTFNIYIRSCWLELTEGAPDNGQQTNGGWLKVTVTKDYNKTQPMVKTLYNTLIQQWYLKEYRQHEQFIKPSFHNVRIYKESTYTRINVILDHKTSHKIYFELSIDVWFVMIQLSENLESECEKKI